MNSKNVVEAAEKEENNNAHIDGVNDSVRVCGRPHFDDQFQFLIFIVQTFSQNCNQVFFAHKQSHGNERQRRPHLFMVNKFRHWIFFSLVRRLESPNGQHTRNMLISSIWRNFPLYYKSHINVICKCTRCKTMYEILCYITQFCRQDCQRTNNPCPHPNLSHLTRPCDSNRFNLIVSNCMCFSINASVNYSFKLS